MKQYLYCMPLAITCSDCDCCCSSVLDCIMSRLPSFEKIKAVTGMLYSHRVNGLAQLQLFISQRYPLLHFRQIARWNSSVGTAFKIGIQIVNAVDHHFVATERIHNPTAINKDPTELFFGQIFHAVE